MNIDDLTVKQIKEINSLISHKNESGGLCSMIGMKVIIRTYSAGVWFGLLEQKQNNEVILKNARRMWQWWAKEGITLSSVAMRGIKQEESKIAEPVDSVWLEAIEIIPCADNAIELIEGAENAKAYNNTIDNGYGYGYGDGSGDGSGIGDGYGIGNGYGSGDGYGSGSGNWNGSGS